MVESVVCLKQVFDVSKITIDSDSNTPILSGVAKKISDFDKNALEEAVKLKEAHGGTVKTLTIGETDKLTENLREALAIGADESVALDDPIFEKLDSYGTAAVLTAAVKKLDKYDIILCGEASIDNYSGQIGPQLAEMLQVPLVSYAKKITVDGDKLKVERNLGQMTEEIEVAMPAVVTVTKEINEPRLPNLMQIMGASGKPITTLNGEALGISAENIGPENMKVKTIEIKGVTMERKRIIFEDDDLENGVREVAQVLIKGGYCGGA
jgi:electron transfer flavoprotein beta subunit